jgi:hypothetical protein
MQDYFWYVILFLPSCAISMNLRVGSRAHFFGTIITGHVISEPMKVPVLRFGMRKKLLWGITFGKV